MKKLHILVLKNFIGPLIASFLISLFVLLMQFLWRYVEDFVGKGLSMGVILEILMYASSSLVPMALPLAVLLASIMVFGNLAEHNELMAIKSAGVSLIRIMQPIMVLTILISIFAFYFANYTVPRSNLKMRSLLYDISNKPPEIIIPTGTFYNELPGYSIKVERRDRETKMLYDLLIYDHSAGRGNTSVTIAEKGMMYYVNEHQYIILHLFNGAMYEDEQVKNQSQRESFPYRRHTFEEQKIVFDITGFGFKRSDENLFKSHYKTLGTKDLSLTIDTMQMKISEQISYLKDNLITTNFFRRLSNPHNDSIKVAFPETKLSTDSLLNSFGLSMQKTTISSALTFARNTQSYIQSENGALKSRQIWKIKHEAEWHNKFTLSLACIVLFFIGAPLGAIIRKGGIGMPVVVSVILFISYYILGMLGKKSAEQSQIAVWLGMWLSTIVFVPLGIFLTSRALKDRVIINIDPYIKLFATPYHFVVKRIRLYKIKNVDKKKK
ncbi:MAG: YjgP/YjgQ family permease [Bacteroidales bacterium]|nr:YjgP/YjgQ family permease [Bacteroidales bacterium]